MIAAAGSYGAAVAMLVEAAWVGLLAVGMCLALAAAGTLFLLRRSGATAVAAVVVVSAAVAAFLELGWMPAAIAAGVGVIAAHLAGG